MQVVFVLFPNEFSFLSLVRFLFFVAYILNHMTNKRKRQSEGRLAQIDIPACAYDYTFEVTWEQLACLLDPPEILPGELEALFNQCARHGNGDVLLNTAIEGGDGDENMLDMDRLDDIIIDVHAKVVGQDGESSSRHTITVSEEDMSIPIREVMVSHVLSSWLLALALVLVPCEC